MNSKLTIWCDRLLEMGWLSAVVAVPLFFNIHSDRVFEPDKLTLLRSIAVLMVVVWLVNTIDQISRSGWEAYKAAHQKPFWRETLFLLVSLLVAIYLVSTLFSVTPTVSWAGSYQRLQGTYTTLSYIVVFAMMVTTIHSFTQVKRVITAVIITSIPVSFYGMLQHFDLDPLPWGGNTVTRIAGHMGNAIFIAAYLIMAVPLTLARILDAFTSILSDEELAMADVIRSSIYIFALAIQLIAIFWSKSRGPWLGIFVGLFAFVLILLVSLRNAAQDRSKVAISDVGKSLLLTVGGVAGSFAIFLFIINRLVAAGSLQSLAGSMGNFVAFVAAIGIVALIIFLLMAARRGWRWLWLSWIGLAILAASWLLLFNFAEPLHERFGDNAVLGDLTAELKEWQTLPSVGRLGQLLQSESRTGTVRVLIWKGALKLIGIHEPLAFPDGRTDPYNFLRPLIGYGPESMYVAYNRFYPPELATVEARNASPDRAHNETFDALVITGGLGFLIWQALYLALFYFAFSKLDVVRSKTDRNLLVALWILGAILAAGIITTTMGLEFLGVAIPLGSILGLVAYLIYYALTARPTGGDEREPFQIDRLLMIALVAAVLAHYVEIHFGIAIAATRLHFFVYLGLIYLVGQKLPKPEPLAAATAVPEPTPRAKKRRRVKPARSRSQGQWSSALMFGLIIGLMIGILGYNFTTYTLPPDKVIASPADLLTSEIFVQSFLLNSRKDFSESPFVFLMMLMTWGLGSLVALSEMVKQRELKFPDMSGGVSLDRQRWAGGLLLLMAVGSLAFRFLNPAGPEVGSTALLGRSALLIWGMLTLWISIQLIMPDFLSTVPKWSIMLLTGIRFRILDTPQLGAVAVAMTGLLFTLPVLIAGGGWAMILIASVCLGVLYLLWHKRWQHSILPAAVMSLLSLIIGLAYAYLHANMLRSSLFFQLPQGQQLSAAAQRVLEASQSAGFLTLFYLFVFGLIFAGGFVLAWSDWPRIRKGGNSVAYGVLAVGLLAAMLIISQTNMQIIQADMIYKRAKPFDEQATRSQNLELWETAVAIYEETLDRTPKEDFYYLFLGRAYLEEATAMTDPAEQRGLLQKAEERLLEAQDINPLNTDHTANLARLNTRWAQLSGDPAERDERVRKAEAYYEDALALSPQNSIIRNEYGRLVFDLLQDCDRSIAVFEESVTIDPYYEVTYFALGDTYVACANSLPEEDRAEYLATAVANYQEGLDRSPRNARAWAQLGQLQQNLGQYEPAVNSYTEAKNLNNRQVPPWNMDYLIATAYQAMGNIPLAEEAAQQALLAAPPEASGQIQQFISQLTGETTAVPPSPTPSAQILPLEQMSLMMGERPLTAIPPVERNNIYQAYPSFVVNPAQQYQAVITTEQGQIRLLLYADVTPITVNNFVYLANQGYYDGVTFHRVLDGFMAQGGDPTGTGGGSPGYMFEDEVDAGLSFDRPGLLAMANAGPGTNGSQFFITLAPTPWLDGNHTIFGEVIEGMEVLNSLTRRDPDTNPDFTGDIIERIDIYASN